jgi:hypothetical protein
MEVPASLAVAPPGEDLPDRAAKSREPKGFRALEAYTNQCGTPGLQLELRS